MPAPLAQPTGACRRDGRRCSSAAAAALLAVLAASCLLPAEPAKLVKHPGQFLLPECKSKKIAILDIGQYAEAHKFPACNLSSVVVNAADGTVYLASERERLGKRAGGHELGAHAGPWYLQLAVASSKYYTPDLDEADIVLVNDYCYYIWWLAAVHTHGRGIKESPGDHLMAGYKAMMETDKWQEKGGEDFVFYDSHPGFAAGNAARPWTQLKCFEVRKSTHIVQDVLMRFVCGQGWPYNKLIVAPYNPGRVNNSLPAVHPELKPLPLEERTLLVFHRSACAQLSATVNNFNAGKLMRRYLAQAFATEDDDVLVKCTNHDYSKKKGGAPPMAYADMFEQMRRSVFCLVLPGDAQSTRRFSEIMTAGCIPVFLGPPYHAMPLIEDVDYRNAAVFIAVQDHSPWLTAKMQASLDSRHKAQHETEARWWLPGADIGNRTIVVRTVDDIIPRLRDFSEEEAAQKLGLMASFRHVFSFEPRLTKPPNAANALLAAVCKRGPLEPVND